MHTILATSSAIPGVVPGLNVSLSDLLNVMVVGGIPLLLIGIAVYADRRTRRGYGLALLALLLFAVVIWEAETLAHAQINARPDLMGVGMAVIFLFLVGLYFTLVLGIGALIEMRDARQRSWRVSLLVAGLVPWLCFFIPVLVLKRLPSLPVMFGLTPEATVLLTLLLPTLIVLAYGVYRCVRPVQPAALRRPTVPAR